MNRPSLKAALIQHRNQGGREQNLAYIEQQVKRSAQAGAELILLQELHNDAYFCHRQDAAAFDLAESIPGTTTERLGRLAQTYQVIIVGSLFEHRGAQVYHNTAVVLERDGTIAGRYRKMHIPEDPGYHEKFYFTPGDLGFVPINTSVGQLGVLVCWDQWFPEAARLMALAGADLLLYPTAIGWDRADNEAEQRRQFEAWYTVQRGHAIANGLPLLCCNRVGLEQADHARGQRFWGASFAVGPQGEVLGQAEHDKDRTLIVDINLARSKQVRRNWPFLRDRRVEAYGPISQRIID